MRRACLLALLLLGGVALATPDEKGVSLVVLQDGQTIEGVVTIDGGTVVIRLGEEDREKGGVEIRLAAESVAEINPRGKAKVTSKAEVHLADGRVLRGMALEQGGVVRVQGKHGEVVVGKSEVLRIDIAAPPPPPKIIDADLGFSVPIPEGWAMDRPVALGERLRMAHESGFAFFSVSVRSVADVGDDADRVRHALSGDLSSKATLRPRDDRFWIEDHRRAYEHSQLKLRVRGYAVIRGDLLLWIHSFCEESAVDPGVVKELDLLLNRVRWLKPRKPVEGVYLDPALQLLVEAPVGAKLRPLADKGAAKLELIAKRKAGTLRAFVDDDPDPRSALLDRLSGEEGEPSVEETSLGKVKVWRARVGQTRAVAYRVGEQTVLLVVRAKDKTTLADLLGSVRLLDRQALLAEADFATRIARKREGLIALLRTKKYAQGLRATNTLLEEAKPDPQLLGLAVAFARASETSVVEPLDALWTASGAGWITEELGRALLERGRAAEESEGGYRKAALAFERAAIVWPTEETAGVAQTFFVSAAESSFKAGNRTQSWARLARARELGSDLEAVDAKERDLRLASSALYVKAKKPSLVRSEARRAYELGAAASKVDFLYGRAEAVQKAREAAAKKRSRGKGGGYSFGIPPTTTGRGNGTRRRIRQTAFSRPTGGSRRVRRSYQKRGRRFRKRPRRTSRRFQRRSKGVSRRVRTTGRFAFDQR
jgi:hypothetical protein